MHLLDGHFESYGGHLDFFSMHSDHLKIFYLYTKFQSYSYLDNVFFHLNFREIFLPGGHFETDGSHNLILFNEYIQTTLKCSIYIRKFQSYSYFIVFMYDF